MRLLRPIAPFIALLLTAVSLSAAPARAEDDARPLPRLVTAADFQIAEEGRYPHAKAGPAERAAPEDAPVRRELASLAGGEQGERIPSRGYLADVVWVERTTRAAEEGAAAPDSDTRILYYSFDAGPWRGRLDSETSVLTRAVLTQPQLAFLRGAERVENALAMARSPYFAQAVAEHRRGVTDPRTADRARLDDLILAVGEYAVDRLAEAQRARSTQALDAQVRAMAAATSGIDFANRDQTFTVFKGMDLAGRRDAAQNAQVAFNSHSTLYYGVQKSADFEDPSGDFWDKLNRHFFAVPLVEPVKAWSLSDKTTRVGIGDLAPLDHVGGAAEMVLYRNNPYTAFDAPMAMNLFTAAATLADIVGGVPPELFQAELLGNLLTRVKSFTDNAKPWIEGVGLVVTVAASTQKLVCTMSGDKDGVCGDYAERVAKVTELLTSGWLDAFEGKLKKARKGQPFDPATFCGQAIVGDIATRFYGQVRKSKLSDYGRGTQLAICAVDEFTTKPLLKLIEKNRPDLYATIQRAGYANKSVLLTADVFKRTRGYLLDLPTVPANMRLEALLAAAGSAVSPTEFLGVLKGAMDVETKAITFLREVGQGKVAMMPLVEQMGEAFWDYAKQKGQAALGSALYDVMKVLTPAKYVDMAYTLGGQGAAMAWDWLTDPVLVKLAMNRRSEDALDIGWAIPRMEPVRYLKVPNGDTRIVSETLTGDYAASGYSVYPIANDPAANNLLVLPGFRASVENQSAFRKEDRDTIDALLGNDQVNLVWHVHRFASAAAVQDLPLEARSAATAFNGNYVDTVVEDSIWPWLDPVVALDGQERLNQQIFGSAIGNYQAIDFTEVYRNQLGDDQDYPLRHQTPGIYSDYTHIALTSGSDYKRFANTFTLFVLPDLSAQQQAVQASSAVYRQWRNGQYTGAGEVQLVFEPSVDWASAGGNGLWAVWLYGNGGLGPLMWSEPVSLGPISGGETRALAFPGGLDFASATLIVYNDTLQGYLDRVKGSRAVVFSEILGHPDTGQRPLIVLPLQDMASTGISLLTPADSDVDGVPDYLDAFAQDPRWAYDGDGDAMADEWETRYGLNPRKAADAVLDPDGDGVGNLAEFLAGTDPRVAQALPAPQNPVAAAGNGRALVSWDPVAGAESYTIYLAEQAGIAAVLPNVALLRGGRAVAPVPTTAYPVDGLTNGTPYFFVVTATRGGREGAPSAEVGATPRQGPSVTGSLNDTGITWGGNYSSGNNPTCIGETIAAQDCSHGRDVTHNDPSDGHAGFSYTKLDGNGNSLPASATAWSCVRDNVTGLVWEMKTDDGGLHDKDDRYNWYNTDPATNGGAVGYANDDGAVCHGYNAGDSSTYCNTQAYVARVNAAGWCGFHDWRLPKVMELLSLVNHNIGYPGPTIDSAFFPNTVASHFWSASPVAGYSGSAWSVHFYLGFGGWDNRYDAYYVRLVRAGQ